MAQEKQSTRQGARKNINKNNTVALFRASESATPQQVEMDLRIEKQVERDGVEMGVLSDGTAFLSGRGLARLCGVHHSRMGEILSEWSSIPEKPRITKIKETLAGQGLRYTSPVIGVLEIDQTLKTYAWPDTVCWAILEYYALDAQQGSRAQALKNYRLLAAKGLHDFIYTEVGYNPRYQIPEHWRNFHDRVSLTYSSVPVGYFCIFKEIAGMIVHLGQNGLHTNSSFVPDISVGSIWGKYWTDNSMESTYGMRLKFDHNYPKYFPQARSNLQHIWCYPEEALGAFSRWFREQYIGQGKFSNYLTSAVKKKELPVSFAQRAIAAYYPGGRSTTV
jgi:hypothetical protein